jgi:hypothetical protein
MSSNTTWNHVLAERGHVVSRTRAMTGRRLPSGLFYVDVTGADFAAIDPSPQLGTLKIFPEASPLDYNLVVRDVWAFTTSWGSGVTLSLGHKSINEMYGDVDSFILAQDLASAGWKGIEHTAKGTYLSTYKTVPLGLQGGDLPFNAPGFVTVSVDAGTGRTVSEFTTDDRIRVFIDFLEFERST